jgi:hypothetical protein
MRMLLEIVIGAFQAAWRGIVSVVRRGPPKPERPRRSGRLTSFFGPD